jgi:hypothetical protein
MAIDDNILLQPVGTSDLIMRVSPFVEARRTTVRTTVTARYRFDAERYTDHPDFTTPFARQDAAIDVAVRLSPLTSIGMRAGYLRTQTPQDLNLSTGLSTSRFLVARSGTGVELLRALGPRSSLALGYNFSSDDLQSGPGVDTRSHAARVRFTRRSSERNTLSVGYRAEQWGFRPGGDRLSHLGTAGWSRRLTRVTSAAIEAGPRATDGRVRPEVLATLTQRIGDTSDAAVTYAHTATLAAGVTGIIEVDSLSARLAHRRPERWEADLSVGGYRNVIVGSDVLAYDLSCRVARAVTRSTWITASFSTSFNSRRIVGVAPAGPPIRRNTLLLSLRVVPWTSR